MTEIFSTTSETQPGYFRIGFVVLQIPPTDISTNKVVNDDQVSTLRTSTPMFVKSGQSRWDVTVHWKAVRFNDDDSQWLDLQNIVAIFKASPFVEVENAFLRQHFTNVQATTQTQRMAFALRQLRIDTDPSTGGIDGGIDVTLTMSLFNYAPFSVDFSYIGSGSAIDCVEYRSFIDAWISQNMAVTIGSSSPSIQSWDDQDEGVLTFKWRQYIYEPFPPEQPPATSNASAGNTPSTPSPQPVTPSNSTKLPSKAKQPSNAIQTIINTAAAAYGVDAAIATSLCMYESGGNPLANQGRVGVGLGLFQVVASTFKGLNVGTDIWDPQTNANAGCKYLAQLYKKFGNYPQAIAAYNTGPGAVKSFMTGKPLVTPRGTINPNGINLGPNAIPPNGSIPGENTTTEVNTVMTNAGYASQIPPIPVLGTGNSLLTTPTTVVMGDNPDQKFITEVNNIITSGVLPPGIWYPEHYTEQGVFFYQENNVTYATAETGGGDFDMFVGQISIVMINTLPTIPLAAMQYPTYQHVGPTETMISISFDSVGDDTDTVFNEPEHAGIEALVGMSNQLENQFHTMAPLFRAVSSIQRMQAAFVENPILNLLGIKGVLLRSINTETVPDSYNLAQASITVSQYENIFEDINPFIMNGIPKAYSSQLASILTSGQLSQLNPEEQKTITVVQQFAAKWQANDPTFLLQQILALEADNVDYLSQVASSVPSANLRPDQKALLLGNLSLTSSQSTTSIILGALIPNASITYQRDTYPALQIRNLSLQKSNIDMTFADYFVFSQLPIVGDGTPILRKTQEAAFASQEPTIYQSMYSTLFDILLQTNQLFAQQALAITKSPLFNSQFATAVSALGPASQVDNNNNPINPGHSCYRDLGLMEYDVDPASYLYNWNDDLNTSIQSVITSSLGTATQSQNVNGGSSIFAGQNQTSHQSSAGIVISADGQGIPGQASALIRSQNTPAYSMAHAYPTFKLLLLEEDNSGPFYCFDNFYSYASVMDIEVIKYRDKPDTAIIQITNLAHTLQHRLYDDTASGKMEREADKFTIDANSGLIRNAQTGQAEAGTGGLPNSIITAQKSNSGVPLQQSIPRVNLTTGRQEATTWVDLKFYALQTGSKIQVRMGFSNNPDKLYPVFTGQVTDIQGDEILTLTCQSFMLELMSNPGTMVASDSLWGFNFLTGGAAYGEYQLMNSGTTLNIMKSMISSPVARHFGHWQVGGSPDQKIKGFSWLPLVGQLASGTSSATLQKIGGLLQTGYDRSGENVDINSITNFDATKSSPSDPKNLASRQFDNENKSFVLGSAAYSIPKQSTLSIWDIIRDVARRYPQYNLMVRDYGFPYGADATLVYSHPLDWYYSRPPLLGDAEKEKPNNLTQNQIFQQWWSSFGAAAWANIVTGNISDGNGIDIVGIYTAIQLAHADLTAKAASGPEGFDSVITQLHGILTGTTATAPSDGALTTIFNAVENVLTGVVNKTNITNDLYLQLDQKFQALYRQWLAYLTGSEPAANSSRVKPVRKYHLIDHNHIIHNGITVKDDIYNAVKIGDKKPYVFNQNIPPQHTRVLDVTAMINNPNKNALQGIWEPFVESYAQSFLREEVGKMYQGELIIRGTPEIEPFDIILLNDVQTATIGPIEVESVIHSFNSENGYITIVKPRLMLMVNEAVSQAMMQVLGYAWASASAEIHNLTGLINFNFFSPNASFSATAASYAGTIAAGFAAASIAAGLVAGTAAAMVIGSLPLLAGGGLLVWGYLQSFTKNNFFTMMPLSRFGRPWIGGVQGFAISDFSYALRQDFRWFDAQEIAPTIESWNELMHYQPKYLPTQLPSQ